MPGTSAIAQEIAVPAANFDTVTSVVGGESRVLAGERQAIEIPTLRRWRPSRHWIPRALLVSADAFAIALAIAGGLIVSALLTGRPVGDTPSRHVLLFAASIPGWVLIFAHYGLYTTRYLRSRMEEFRRTVHACGAAVLGMAMAGYMLEVYASRGWLIGTALIGIVTVTAERALARCFFSALRRRGRMLRPIVLVGGNDEGLALCATLMDDPSLGYRVVGFVDDRAPADAYLYDHRPVLGTVAQTLEAVRRTGANGVVIATTGVDFATSNRLTRELTEAGVHVELSIALRDVVAERLTLKPLGRFPVVYVEPAHRGGWRAAAKRSLDLIVAAIGLVLTAPVLAVIAVAVRIDSKGPALFRQVRVGKDGAPFEVLKFRTMIDGAEGLRLNLGDENEAGGPLFKMTSDPRITRIGGWLRRCSLDELPQLINVIKGEMSMVGPRPALASEMVDWTPELHGRLRVKPGITGMWQVSRGKDWSWDDYVRLDLHYVDNWSLLTDLAIGLKTIPTMLFSRSNK